MNVALRSSLAQCRSVAIRSFSALMPANLMPVCAAAFRPPPDPAIDQPRNNDAHDHRAPQYSVVELHGEPEDRDRRRKDQQHRFFYGGRPWIRKHATNSMDRGARK